MKTIVIFLFIIICPILSYSQSEGLRIGATGGIGQSKIHNSSLPDNSKLSALGGISYSYQFNKFLGLYGNVLYVSKGAKIDSYDRINWFFGYTDYSYHRKISISTIEIPIMPKISYGFNKFYFKGFIGPSFNFILSAKDEKTYDDSSYNKDNGYSKKDLTGASVMEFSLVFGGGVDVEVSGDDVFFLEFRDNVGLSNFASINGMDSQNRNFNICVGYLFKY
jgi:hypothetical protein